MKIFGIYVTAFVIASFAINIGNAARNYTEEVKPEDTLMTIEYRGVQISYIMHLAVYFTLNNEDWQIISKAICKGQKKKIAVPKGSTDVTAQLFGHVIEFGFPVVMDAIPCNGGGSYCFELCTVYKELSISDC